MKIIVLDDEELAVDNLLGLLKKVEPTSTIIGFSEVEDALDFLKDNQVDIAFLDIEMGAYNGIDLAKMCKTLCPNVNIIFVTGYSKYSIEAFKLHVSGYVMKPVREVDLLAELENLRVPVYQRNEEIVRIQTFGNFEIFVDDKPLAFPRSKCLECIAYLVDRRGARVTTSELAAILWEDRPFDRTLQNNVHRIISDMMLALKRAGVEDIVIKRHHEIAINIKKVDCDYYKLLEDPIQLRSYQGEYMSNYSWPIFSREVL